jgi:hypothetical protein
VLHRARLYLLSHLASAAVTKYSECLIVLGPVRGTLRLADCRKLTVVAACGRAVLSDCHDCRLLLRLGRLVFSRLGGHLRGLFSSHLTAWFTNTYILWVIRSQGKFSWPPWHVIENFMVSQFPGIMLLLSTSILLSASFCHFVRCVI